jgi:hypothetical protein
MFFNNNLIKKAPCIKKDQSSAEIFSLPAPATAGGRGGNTESNAGRAVENGISSLWFFLSVNSLRVSAVKIPLSYTDQNPLSSADGP